MCQMNFKRSVEVVSRSSAEFYCFQTCPRVNKKFQWGWIWLFEKKALQFMPNQLVNYKRAKSFLLCMVRCVYWERHGICRVSACTSCRFLTVTYNSDTFIILNRNTRMWLNMKVLNYCVAFLGATIYYLEFL